MLFNAFMHDCLAGVGVCFGRGRGGIFVVPYKFHLSMLIILVICISCLVWGREKRGGGRRKRGGGRGGGGISAGF